MEINTEKEENRKEIIKEIKRLYREGSPLYALFISFNNRRFMGMCERNFGSWAAAIQAAGLDYSKIRRTLVWSKKKIIFQIKERYKSKEPLNAKYMIENDNRLYSAGRKHFGSWKLAIEHAGLDYSKIKKKPISNNPFPFVQIWSDDKIIDDILCLYKQKLPLNTTWARKHHSKLFYAAIEYFSSWGNAITYAGLDYNKIRKYHEKWTREHVILEIRKLHNQGKPLNYQFVKREVKSLIGEATILFGSWEFALKAAGFDSSLIRKRKKWNKKKIKYEVRKRKREGKSITYSGIKRDDFPLFRAIQRYYRKVPKV